MHRAFHALPPLTSKKGELVNAVYGFFSMFLKILQDVEPSYTVVCFDKAAPTFRQQLYVGYQAQRPKTADELVPQIQIIHAILEKAKVAIFEIDGYEADDLIGTLAVQALRAEVGNENFRVPHSQTARHANSENFVPSPRLSSSDIEVIIVSGDRDMLQLVNSHVKVLMPIIGITKMQLMDATAVEEKYGIKPTQIVDYKALVGDASDNYPGVSGVGPKTAMELLKEFKTLEEVYKNLEQIQKKNPNLALKLAQGAEQAGLAKKLAAIVTDAPITLDIERCDVLHFDMEGAKECFSDLGFKSLLKRLQVSDSQEKPRGAGSASGGKKENPGQKEDSKKQENNQLGLLDEIASS